MNRSPNPAVAVLATGSYLPERVVTNEEIAQRVPGASAEWIERKTGIRSRRYAAPGEAASDLAVNAALAALDQANVPADRLDYIIVATTTGDQPVPATAVLVQRALSAYRAACLDINSACSGFVTALSVAQAYAVLRPGATSLVIGADVWSRFVDFGDRATSVLFGDGAGAVVIGAASDGADEGSLIDIDITCRGDVHELISLPAGGSRQPPSARTLAERGHSLHMQGRAVREFVLGNVPAHLVSLLKRCGYEPSDVHHFVPHQANARLVTELAEVTGLAAATTHLPVRYCGNIGAASVPVALDVARRAEALRDGDLVLLAGFGAGMASAAALLRWAAPVLQDRPS